MHYQPVVAYCCSLHASIRNSSQYQPDIYFKKLTGNSGAVFGLIYRECIWIQASVRTGAAFMRTVEA